MLPKLPAFESVELIISGVMRFIKTLLGKNENDLATIDGESVKVKRALLSSFAKTDSISLFQESI